MNKPLRKLISGGQTGVDRGALDAALDLGFECGGWCPRGRKAEDGPIPERYPLTEVDGGYAERTEANVRDSDATVIVHHGPVSGGTRLTHALCRKWNRPCLLLDLAELDPHTAAGKLADFVQANRISILNVAGPRASSWPQAHAMTSALLKNSGF